MTPGQEWWLVAAAGAAAYLFSAVLTPFTGTISRRIGYVDRPGAHKSHIEPKPYGGGVAMFAVVLVLFGGLLVAAWLVPQAWLAEQFGELARAHAGGLRLRSGSLAVVLGCCAVLHVTGVIDDRRALGPWTKLLVMVAVALATPLLAGLRIADFAGLPAATLLSALWIIVITNAMNFLDNMDGLSGGITAIAAGFFTWCGLAAGQVHVPLMAAVLAGAALGFLTWNFPPARLFMGDAGSLVLGYLLAVVAIMTSYYDSGSAAPPYTLLIPVVILAVPLYDFASVVLIRLREGRNPMLGDQRHFSHRLVEHGLSRRSAVLTIYLATFVTGLAATLLPGAGLRECITVACIVAAVLAIIAILESPVRPPA